MLNTFDRLFYRSAMLSGVLACIAMILMLFNVFYDVIMRYALNDVSIGMQELEWHLFALVFLFGTPYAMAKDGHVRVDILYEAWTDKRKAWINLLGAVGFVMPFCVLVIVYGWDFTQQAYEINEGSGDPGGLPYRWIIKGMIPLSFVFIALAACGMVTRAIKVLMGQDTDSAGGGADTNSESGAGQKELLS